MEDQDRDLGGRQRVAIDHDLEGLAGAGSHAGRDLDAAHLVTAGQDLEVIRLIGTGVRVVLPGGVIVGRGVGGGDVAIAGGHDDAGRHHVGQRVFGHPDLPRAAGRMAVGEDARIALVADDRNRVVGMHVGNAGPRDVLLELPAVVGDRRAGIVHDSDIDLAGSERGGQGHGGGQHCQRLAREPEERMPLAGWTDATPEEIWFCHNRIGSAAGSGLPRRMRFEFTIHRGLIFHRSV